MQAKVFRHKVTGELVLIDPDHAGVPTSYYAAGSLEHLGNARITLLDDNGVELSEPGFAQREER